MKERHPMAADLDPAYSGEMGNEPWIGPNGQGRPSMADDRRDDDYPPCDLRTGLHTGTCTLCAGLPPAVTGDGLALRAVESRGPREVLTAALLRGPGRYSRSGSQALAERLLLALEDAGYVIGEARP